MCVAVLSVPVALTFKPIVRPSEPVHGNEYEELRDPPVDLTTQAKMTAGGIWLVTAVLKSTAYFTPIITLVSYSISNYNCNIHQ